jgi:hypothetical protein
MAARRGASYLLNELQPRLATMVMSMRKHAAATGACRGFKMRRERGGAHGSDEHKSLDRFGPPCE